MSEYDVVVNVSTFATLEIEAENKKEAEDDAWNKSVSSLDPWYKYKKS